MPDAAWHLTKAARFEAFVEAAYALEPQPPEWIVIAQFYTALHYVDAFYATQGQAHIGSHGRRRQLLRTFAETNAIEDAYRLLEKASQEARYEGDPFDSADVERSKRLYAEVSRAMRRALRL